MTVKYLRISSDPNMEFDVAFTPSKNKREEYFRVKTRLITNIKAAENQNTSFLP